MDLAGRFLGVGAALQRPGADFVFADSKKADVVEKAIGFRNKSTYLKPAAGSSAC